MVHAPQVMPCPSTVRPRGRPTALAAAALIAVGAAAPVAAAEKTWVCASSSFAVAGCWSPAGVPLDGDNLRLVPRFVDGAALPVTLVLIAGSSVRAGSVLVDATGLAPSSGGSDRNLLRLMGGRLAAGTVSIGDRGAALLSQSGGTLAADTLQFALQAGSDGQALLTGSATLETGSTTVGLAGQALFSQAGGLHRSTSLVVGGGSGSGRYLLSAGQVQVVSLRLGDLGGSLAGGSAVFEQTGGALAVDDAFTLAWGSRYMLSGSGTLVMPAGVAAINFGSVEQFGGRFTGALDNRGRYTLGAGPGADQVATPPLFVGTLGNAGSLLWRGGTLQATGTLSNTGLIDGHGQLVGDFALVNDGLVQQGAGTLVIGNAGGVHNHGSWIGQATQALQLVGVNQVFNNQGQLLLAGGRITGAGTLNNRAGATLGGSGTVAVRLDNAGALTLSAGERLAVTGVFNNSGLVELGAAGAALAGARLVNSGLVSGQGSIGNDLHNLASGRVQAERGVLLLDGAVTNDGLLAVGAGATLLLRGALSNSGSGRLQMAGGTLDLAGQPLDNTGLIAGFGTLRGSAIANIGQLQFGAGDAWLQADVDNLAGSRITVSGGAVASFAGVLRARAGSELRVSAGSAAVFFGPVSQETGAVFSGSGTRYFEGGLSVGASPGLGGTDGDAVLGEASLYRAEIGGPGLGSGFDHFAAGGALQFGGTLQLSLLGGFAPQAGQRFDLFDWGSTSGRFARLDLAAAPLDAGLRWDASQLYVDGSLAVAAVPEPAHWALLASGLTLLLCRRRPGRQPA